MKLYLHFHTLLSKPMTAVVVLHSDQITVTQLSKFLKQEFKQRAHPVEESLELCMFKRKSKSNSKVQNDSVICKYFQHMEDVHCEFISQSDAEKSDSSASKDCQCTNNLGDKLPTNADSCSSDFSPTTLNDWLTMARKLQKRKHYRNTLQILKALIDTGSGTEKIYDDIVSLYLEVNRLVDAHYWLNKTEQAFPDYRKYKLRLAQYYLRKQEPDLALENCLDYARVIRQDGAASMQEKHQVQLLMAEAYQKKKQKDMAIVILHAVVKELQEKNEENSEAVLEYAKLVYNLNPERHYETTRLALHALVTHKDNKLSHKGFTEVMKCPGAIAHLERTLQEFQSKDNPFTYAFIGNIIRCYGAVAESLLLFEKAIVIKPVLPQVVLSYAHLLETVCDYEKAFRMIMDYLSENLDAGVGTLCNKHIHNYFKNKTILTTGIYIYDDRDYLMDLSDTPPDVKVPDTYTENDLYILGIWFTLVKVLYVNCATNLTRSLVKVLDQFHAKKNLHESLLRNEAAFYSCISKLCSLRSTEPQYAPVVPQGESVVMYVLGDSHCVTTAWREITHQGIQYILFPLLCTGTKIWHLRPECEFYTKVNFEKQVEKLPVRSTVVFQFGEIDCRESVLRCWEKCLYESYEECIDKLISIYIKVLIEIQKRKDFTIYVHPVPPVLDITRDIVMLFNKMLEEKLANEKTLHWLPLQDKLLSKNEGSAGDDQKYSLLSKYEFDGTHLHPCYVKEIEDVLNSLSL